MPGIFPDPATAGGLVFRDATGAPTNPPNVQNARAPAPAFLSTCEMTALPSDCTARIEPRQVNALVSELLSLAECLDPNGPWDCDELNNLCAAFASWVAINGAGTLYTKTQADARFVNVVGDTMTGPLALPGDPTIPVQASTKKYVDDRIVAVEAIDTTDFVNATGDTMTGHLGLPATPGPTQAVRKDYADSLALVAINAAAIRYDVAQALIEAQQTQARKNAYAAPFDAMAKLGMQINGSFDIVHEKPVGTISTAQGDYFCDAWQINRVGTMGIAVGLGPGAVGGGNYFTSTVSAAQPVLAGPDGVNFRHSIEGFRMRRAAFGSASARAITVAFMSAHNPAGLYSVACRNSAMDRSYVAPYTQLVANAWQWNVISIPGDTLGAWAWNNQRGAFFNLTMASGADGIAPAPNAWHAGNFTAVPGQVNGVASTANTFFISNFFVFPGNEAPTQLGIPNATRTVEDELVLCQRQMFVINWDALADVEIASGMAWGGTNCLYPIRYPVQMRAAPTISVNNPADFKTVSTVGFVVPSSMGGQSIGTHSADVFAVISPAIGANDMVTLRTLNTTARIFFKAQI